MVFAHPLKHNGTVEHWRAKPNRKSGKTRHLQAKGQALRLLALLLLALFWSAALQGCERSQLQRLAPMQFIRIDPLTTLQTRNAGAWRLAGIQVVDEEGAKALLRGFSNLPLDAAADQRLLDRYERTWAYLWHGDTMVQAVLLEAGVAVVWPRPGQMACLEHLNKSEEIARNMGRGAWHDWPLSVTATQSLGKIAAGQFVVLEGRVKSVGETSARRYLNFGDDYSSDTSAVIERKHLKRFRSAGMELSKLKGKRLRLRGFLGHRNGPYLSLAFPEQIELLD